MDIKNLNTFIQVAELGNFSRAGERLGYSQPTISVQIKQLEEELGFRLFDRIGHAVRLTEKGREALFRAQEICRMCEELTQDTGEENAIRGRVRLAMADSLCAPLMLQGLSALREKYPHIGLDITTAGTDEMFRFLDQNEVDAVCTLDSRIYNTNYVIAGEEKVGVHFAVPCGHPLAEKKTIPKDILPQQEFFLTEKNMSYRQLLDAWMARDSMELHPVLELGSADLICRLVERGMGISFLPDYVTETAVRQGTVRRMSAKGFAPELWKQILYRRDKWVSRPMEAVLEVLIGLHLGHDTGKT